MSDTYSHLLTLLDNTQKMIDSGDVANAKGFLSETRKYAARYHLEIPKDRISPIEDAIDKIYQRELS